MTSYVPDLLVLCKSSNSCSYCASAFHINLTHFFCFQIFSRFGKVLKIVTFTKNSKYAIIIVKHNYILLMKFLYWQSKLNNLYVFVAFKIYADELNQIEDERMKHCHYLQVYIADSGSIYFIFVFRLISSSYSVSWRSHCSVSKTCKFTSLYVFIYVFIIYAL